MTNYPQIVSSFMLFDYSTLAHYIPPSFMIEIISKNELHVSLWLIYTLLEYLQSLSNLDNVFLSYLRQLLFISIYVVMHFLCENYVHTHARNRTFICIIFFKTYLAGGANDQQLFSKLPKNTFNPYRVIYAYLPYIRLW